MTGRSWWWRPPARAVTWWPGWSRRPGRIWPGGSAVPTRTRAWITRDRAELARELLPGLPVQAAERVARRTATFGEVFAVAAADKVAGLGPGTGAAEAVAAADAVIDAVLDRAVPSREAAVLGLGGRGAAPGAGGGVPAGPGRGAGPRRTFMCGGPGRWRAWPIRRRRRCAEQAAAFSARQRAALAGAVLEAAGQVAADPGAGLADRVVARQAVHRVRADLDPALRGRLPLVQRALIRGLETLGDPRGRLAGRPAGAGRDAVRGPPGGRDC